jgi:hypothetical protein
MKVGPSTSSNCTYIHASIRAKVAKLTLAFAWIVFRNKIDSYPDTIHANVNKEHIVVIIIYANNAIFHAKLVLV